MIVVAVLESEDFAGQYGLDRERLTQFAEHVLAESVDGEGEVNVVLVDDGVMTSLNKTYKGRERTTDVLSFDLSDNHGGFAGEVYISPVQAERQAGEYGVPFEEEIVRLVAHGLLHLAGRVHNTEETSEAMTVETERFVAFWREMGQ